MHRKRGKKSNLHRFTAASAFGRYSKIHENKIGGQMSMDIAFPEMKGTGLKITS